MKARVRELLTPAPADVDRRSFFRTLGLTAGAAAVDVAGGVGGGRRQLRAEQRQARLRAVQAADHRPARRRRREGADDVPVDSHRHQSGAGRLGRGARWRQRDLRARAQEPAARREPLQRRSGVPQDQAVRRSRATGRRRVRRRDGLHGPRRQGVGRAGLADARRQVPRSGAAVCRHDRDRRSEGAGPAPEGAHGSRHHLPEAGFRHRPAARQARHAERAARREHRPGRTGAASVHRHRDHASGHRVAVGLGRRDPRGDRDGGPAVVGSLRPHRRQQLHPPREGDGEAQPGVDGGHGAVAVRRADEADPRRLRHSRSSPARTSS